jgi:hypothetical protein
VEPLGRLLAAEACRPHSLQKSQTFRSKPRVCGVPDFQTSNVLGIRFDQFAKASVDARSCAKRTFWGNARFVRFGRFDPFVKPSANGGYLRIPAEARYLRTAIIHWVVFARQQSHLRDVRTKLAESPLADEELVGGGLI